jgi:sterol desaturase/sphingolipid hydroxylase (fatty acid hydroxylase superfamily)
MLSALLHGQALQLAYSGAIVLVFLILERFFPAERQPLTAAVFNLLFALAGYVFITLQAYFFGKLFTFVLVTRQDWLTSVNFVHQQLGSVEFCWRLPIYLLVIDFLSYWEHRALHRIPILWRLHKLHHSDRNVNASTARREHWLSDGVYMITILVPGAVMFGALDLPVAALIAYMATGFYNHANIRLHLGKLTAIVSGPQFHRIHHSILPEHYDKNFSGLFPIFDILFGTYHRPSRNEFPPTGLTDERIESQWVAHFGPFSRSERSTG